MRLDRRQILGGASLVALGTAFKPDAAHAASIQVVAPVPAPTWALLQRELIRINTKNGEYVERVKE